MLMTSFAAQRAGCCTVWTLAGLLGAAADALLFASATFGADARKQALASGTFGTFDASRGGWLEAWDDVAAPRVLAAPKLHKRERTRADRFASIEANLADMPKKIAAYRAAVDARKPPPGVESLMKRLTRRRK